MEGDDDQGTEFLMETNKHCFICLGHVSGGSLSPTSSSNDGEVSSSTSRNSTSGPSGMGRNSLNNEEGIVASFQKVCAHLKIDVPRVFKDTIRLSLKQLNLSDNMDKWELKGRFCPECASVADEFKQLFIQLEAIQLKVDKCLSTVQRKFLEGNSNHMKIFQVNMAKQPSSLFHYAFVDTLRKEAIEKCSQLLDKKPLPKGMSNKLQKNQQQKQKSQRNRNLEPDIVELKQELAPEPEILNVEEEEIDPAPPILSPIISSVRGSYPDPGEQPSTSAAARAQDHLQRQQKVMHEIFHSEFEVDPATIYENDEDENEEIPLGLEPEGRIEEVELDDDDEPLPGGNASPRRESASAAAVSTPTAAASTNHRYGLRSSNKKIKSKRYQCQSQNCRRPFKSLKEMEIHRRRLHAGMEFVCKMCPKAFPTSHAILCHTKRVHVKPEVQNSRRNNSWECDICHKVFKKRQYMMQHRSAHLGKKYQCTSCGKLFNHSSNFYAHKRDYHRYRKGDVNNIPRAITVYSSSLTPTVTAGPSNTSQNHQRRRGQGHQQSAPVVSPLRVMKTERIQLNRSAHEEEELGSFIIPMDGQGGDNETIFDPLAATQTPTSARIATGNMRKGGRINGAGGYKCDHCGKSFQKMVGLTIHISHKHPVIARGSGPRIHQCDICDRIFPRPGILRDHKNRDHFRL